MLSIPDRAMSGGGGGDLDNDTIQPHVGKSGATFPGGSKREEDKLPPYLTE